jgi:phospholipid/cholesterol/gamma-HCH transport system substrate-binding protein
MSDASVIRRERTEIFVGLFIIVGLAIMAVLIWNFGSFTDRFRPKYELKIVLNDATGIIQGAPIRYGGTKVGVVKSKEIAEDFTSMVMTVEIFDEYKIPAGSKFVVTTSGLMGDRFVNIFAPDEPTEERIKPGSTIVSSGGDMMAEFSERAARVSDKVEIVLEELDKAVSETRVMVANLTSVSEKFDQRVLAEDNLENFTEAIANLRTTTTNLAEGSGKIAPLLDETRETVAAAREPFDRASELIKKLEPAIEELQPAFAELKPLLAEVQPTLAEIRGVATQLNYAIERVLDGDGIAGAVISDPELRDDLKSFVETLEEHGVLGYKKGRQEDKKEDEPKAAEPEEKPKGKGLFRRKN